MLTYILIGTHKKKHGSFIKELTIIQGGLKLILGQRKTREYAKMPCIINAVTGRVPYHTLTFSPYPP